MTAVLDAALGLLGRAAHAAGALVGEFEAGYRVGRRSVNPERRD